MSIDTEGGEQLATEPAFESATDSVRKAFAELDAGGGDKDVPIDLSDKGKEEKPVDVRSAEQRARDEQGRFAKQELTATEAKTEAPKDERITPPPAWRGDAKVDWSRLPRHVQQALSDDYKRLGETEQKWTPLQQVLAPREQVLAAQYGSIPNALNQLFQLSDFAEKNPAQFLQWFAQQRNIDLRQFVPAAQPQNGVEAQPGTPPGTFDPAAVKNELLSAVRQEIAQQQFAQLSQSAVAEVQSFTADPRFPYANDVKQDMAALFHANQATTLQEAYDKAVWMRPEIRSKLIADQERQKAETAAAEAARKRAVAVSVTGAPYTAAPVANSGRRESARETVARALEEAGRL